MDVLARNVLPREQTQHQIVTRWLRKGVAALRVYDLIIKVHVRYLRVGGWR